MGYISPGMVAKKHYNWKVPNNAPPVPAVSRLFEIHTSFASMNFFTEYQNAFESIVPLTGGPNGWDPSQIGNQFALTPDAPPYDTGIYNGTSSAVGSGFGFNGNDTVLEYQITSADGAFPNLGIVSLGTFTGDLDGDLTQQAEAIPFLVYLRGSDFMIVGSGGVEVAQIPPLVNGDCLGIVQSGFDVHFFVNGVEVPDTALLPGDFASFSALSSVTL